MDPADIRAEILARPAEINADDVKRFGDISKINMYTDVLRDQLTPPLVHMFWYNNNFGYTSPDDTVSYDPDNLLNMLINQIKNSYTEKEFTNFKYMLDWKVHEYIRSFKSARSNNYAWQVLVRLVEEFTPDIYTNPEIYGFEANRFKDLGELAIVTNCIQLLKYLMDRPGFRSPNLDGFLIQTSVLHNRRDIIKYLVSKGVDTTKYVSWPSGTAYAASRGNPTLMANLLGSKHVLSSSAKPERRTIKSEIRHIKPSKTHRNSSQLGKNAVNKVEEIVARQALSRRAHLLGMANSMIPPPRAGAGGPNNSKGGSRRRRHRTVRR